LILYSKNFSLIVQKTKEKNHLSFRLQNIFFWLFALSGLSLMVTSLFMMLPLFVQQTQTALFEIHRYSALLSVLSSVLFLYSAFIENEQR
jgi:hypothetical protein